MKRRFAIFSLPRSGSSWLSQFLSMPGSYCYHEPLADMTYDVLEERIEVRPEPAAGFIDTSAHQRRIPDLEGFNRYVIIREPAEIRNSLRLRGWVFSLELELEKLTNSTRDCIQLHYKWFNDLDYLASIWASVVGEPFDRERAEYLMEMNVQRTFASVTRRLQSAHRPHPAYV